MRPRFEHFKDQAMVERYFEAYRRAGMPDQMNQISHEYAAVRLDHDQLRSLYTGGTRKLWGKAGYGAPFIETYRPDGTMETRYPKRPDWVFTGTWDIYDGQICHRLRGIYMGRRFCASVFRNLKRSGKDDYEFVSFTSWGPRWLSPRLTRPPEIRKTERTKKRN